MMRLRLPHESLGEFAVCLALVGASAVSLAAGTLLLWSNWI
jgi:hypothetical protein